MASVWSAKTGKRTETYILYVENPNSQETQKVSVYDDLGYGMKDFQEAAGEKLTAQTNQRYAEYYKLKVPEESAYKIHLSRRVLVRKQERIVYDTDMEKVSANIQHADVNGTWRDNIYHLNAGIYYVEAKMVQSYGTDYTGRESSYSLSLKEPVLHTKLVNPAPTMMEAGESTRFKSDSYEPYDAEDAADYIQQTGCRKSKPADADRSVRRFCNNYSKKCCRRGDGNLESPCDQSSASDFEGKRFYK
ncbi:MAG: hypothetical protein V8S14_07390 [Lachnospiraceae bacterium]